MPSCLKSIGTYKGTEPSPKGRGYCAKGEDIGKKMKGLDKNMWIVSKTKNGQKRWIKYTKKIKSKKKSKVIKTPKKNLSRKSNFDKYINKVILVKLPNNSRQRYRWITRKNNKGRYYARTPKIGVLIRELDLKRDSDYGKETILPVNTTHNY